MLTDTALRNFKPKCRVPDDWLLHNRRALLIGREVLRGLLAEFAGRAPTC